MLRQLPAIRPDRELRKERSLARILRLAVNPRQELSPGETRDQLFAPEHAFNEWPAELETGAGSSPGTPTTAGDRGDRNRLPAPQVRIRLQRVCRPRPANHGIRMALRRIPKAIRGRDGTARFDAFRDSERRAEF